VKFARVVILEMCLIALAGCQPGPSVEEARALCAKQGGFLVVFHTQKVTMSGLGPEVETPGDCLSPSKFGLAPASPGSSAVPAN
jgi:hypothetical protein